MVIQLSLTEAPWFELDTDAKGIGYVRIDRTRKLPLRQSCVPSVSVQMTPLKFLAIV